MSPLHRLRNIYHKTSWRLIDRFSYCAVQYNRREKQWKFIRRIDISIYIGVTVKVSTDNHSRSTLFSPQKNWTGVIKIIILVWPEGRILGRVWERGVDVPPVYKPTSECSVHHTTTRPPQDNMKAFLVGIPSAVKVLCDLCPAFLPWPVNNRASLWDCYLFNCLIL